MAASSSIWQTLAELGHPLGLAMRQLAAGLLSPNSASEADSLASTLGRIAGVGPVSTGLHSRYTTPPLVMPAAMMGFEGGGLRLPKLPSALPMNAQALLFQHPELPLPHYRGDPAVGSLTGKTPWGFALPEGGLGVQGLGGSTGEATMSNPGAFKPVPGVQQNLGPISDLPISGSKWALLNEGRLRGTRTAGDILRKEVMGTEAPTSPSTPSQPPAGWKPPPPPPTPDLSPKDRAAYEEGWNATYKALGPDPIAPNSPEVTQKLHDGYLNIWRNLSPSPQLQNAFETNLKRFIEDASRAGSTHDKAELDGARRALESIQRLKQPPPQGPNFGRQEW